MTIENIQSRSTSITSTLNIYGWEHLDAILLGVLSTNLPVLLIGNHGTAKTHLVKLLAQTLDMEFRHYNASLLNYDDLVGIPMPDSETNALSFMSTPGAIWNAEFVFFDEISRCRADLQNKLFPIIHERTIVGLPLEKLQFRWAAMNPPMPDSDDEQATEVYIGSESLDRALTDRFPFIIPVPDWDEFTREEKRKLLSSNYDDSLSSDLDLHDLIERTQNYIYDIHDLVSEWMPDYLIYLMDLLDRAQLPQSPRRAQIFTNTIVAVHAARMTLEGEDADIATSAELAIRYGIPNTASELPPSVSQIVGLHRQAWEIITRIDDETWRTIYEEPNPIQRLLIGIELDIDIDDLSTLVTQALAYYPEEPRKLSLATSIFLAFRNQYDLNPSAWEPLANLASQVLLPQRGEQYVQPNSSEQTLWNQIQGHVLLTRQNNSKMATLETNFLLAGFPSMWQVFDWKESLKTFANNLATFGVKEETL